MRTSALLLAIGLTAGTLAMAADAPTVQPKTTFFAPEWSDSVSLRGDDDLQKLKVSNPRHYGIARKILAAASEICAASDPAPILAKFDAQDIACAQGIWLTSNPPKRELHFKIEHTFYYALVTVRDTGAKAQPTR